MCAEIPEEAVTGACNCPASYGSAAPDRGHDDTCPQSGTVLSRVLPLAAEAVEKLPHRTLVGRGAAEWYATAALRAAIPQISAAGTRAHRAEQDTVHADLSQLLRGLGMGDHARPQSSHDVMLDAINEAGRIRTRLAELENAVSWQTSCTSCAATLDASYQATVRAESAEEKLAQIRDLAGELVTSPGVRRLVLGILDGAS
jgi:hypothetical protein